MTPPASKRFKEFNSFWSYESDPGRVQTLLKSVSVKEPLRYNQLMVAYDQVQAIYAIYASGGHVRDGKPSHDAGTPFDLVFDRGNLPSQFYP
jgi:hypothetical protein